MQKITIAPRSSDIELLYFILNSTEKIGNQLFYSPSKKNVTTVEVMFPNLQYPEETLALCWESYNNRPSVEEITAFSKKMRLKYACELSVISGDSLKFCFTKALKDVEVSNLVFDVLDFAPETINVYKTPLDMENQIKEDKSFVIWFD